jgi:RNA polymerase sigma-70 factor (ECF subfamily)
MDSLQQLITSYAYNIVGSVEEAKDIAQDVQLEKFKRKGDAIENEKAYFIRAAINRAINAKNRQRKMLSGYPGIWLPEPVATERADHDLNQKDILSYSLMVLLEKLDARQRAVFILKEAFDYDHEEIAQVLNISVENSRKILSRARKEVKTKSRNSVVKAPAGYLDKFINIIRNGDTARLEQLLSNDVVLMSDGGGKAAAALHPLSGKHKALAFLSGIYRKFYKDKRIEKVLVNHNPALVFYEQGKLTTCQVFELQNEKIVGIYFVRNPDKLVSLQQGSNVSAQLSACR